MKTRSLAARQAATSSQVRGVDTVGRGLARSEYGAMVVLEALFWLQSTRTFPGRSDLVILEITRSGRDRSSSWANSFAFSLASSALTPLIRA